MQGSTPKTSYVKMHLVQKSAKNCSHNQPADSIGNTGSCYFIKPTTGKNFCIRKSNGNACACLIIIGIL